MSTPRRESRSARASSCAIADEELLVEAVLRQEEVGELLRAVLLLQLLLLLVEDLPIVGGAHRVASPPSPPIGARHSEQVREPAVAAHTENEENEDQQPHQGDRDRVAGR